MKRLLDCNASDFFKMNKQEKLMAIEASEGRTLIQEISLFGKSQLIEPLTDAEVACAFGADIILLNAFDCDNPKIPGIEGDPADVIKKLKKYTGRMIGLNLEPVGEQSVMGKKQNLPKGRLATIENALKAKEYGFDLIVLCGNPSTGVDNESITKALREINQAVGEELILVAGKMHASGSKNEAGENIISKEIIDGFIEEGADIILIPAPGTVPGITMDHVRNFTSYIHKANKLVLTAIGTSQEGAGKNVIEQIALMCKMAGTDIHHIGDAAIGGMDPQNLMTYSNAIRGKRHTYLRMARSINR